MLGESKWNALKCKSRCACCSKRNQSLNESFFMFAIHGKISNFLIPQTFSKDVRLPVQLQRAMAAEVIKLMLRE